MRNIILNFYTSSQKQTRIISIPTGISLKPALEKYVSISDLKNVKRVEMVDMVTMEKAIYYNHKVKGY